MNKWHKPNLYNICLGTAFSVLKINRNLENDDIPKRILHYKLLSPIKKNNAYTNYFVGLYRHEGSGNKFFIKTWKGQVKDLQYYSLINEYIAVSVIYKTASKISTEHETIVKIPRPRELVESENGLSLILEWVDGEMLTQCTPKTQAEALWAIRVFFEIITENLSPNEKQKLQRRGKGFYLFSLPILTAMAILSNPRSIFVIARAFFRCVKETPSLVGEEMAVSHRDLNLDNILVNGKLVYLLDFEKTVVTARSFDQSLLSCKQSLAGVYNELVKHTREKSNNFLRYYVMIQQSESFNLPSGTTNYYLDALTSELARV